MSEPKKFDLSPSVSILIAGVIVAGAILVTHFFPAGAPAVATADQQNTQGTSVQEQMSPALYTQLATSLGADPAKFASCVAAKTYQSKIDTDTAEAQKAGGQGTPFTMIVDTKTGKALPVSGALPLEQLQAAIAAVNTEGTKSTIRPPSAQDHIIGSPTAPIVLVEYSDFQCPYCKMIHPSLQQIVSDSKGQIAWVYRDFPLTSIHPQAEPSATAAECITAQLGNDAFWKFANTIFEG